mgnify:CR=1 FL=1
MMRAVKTESGWEIWDGVAFEADSIVFATRAAAKQAAEMANAETAAWNRAGLADAPHLDAF